MNFLEEFCDGALAIPLCSPSYSKSLVHARIATTGFRLFTYGDFCKFKNCELSSSNANLLLFVSLHTQIFMQFAKAEMPHFKF